VEKHKPVVNEPLFRSITRVISNHYSPLSVFKRFTISLINLNDFFSYSSYKARNKKLSTSSTSSFIACYGANTLASSAAGTNNTNKINNKEPSLRIGRSIQQFTNTNSYSSVTSSSDPSKTSDNLATISNFYSINTHSPPIDENSKFKNNGISGKDLDIHLDSFYSDNDFKNYEVYSYYPKLYSLSTFGRNEECPNGSTPIKTSINTQIQIKNSDLSKTNSLSNKLQNQSNSNVTKSTSKIFPRTNPLYSRNNGARSKTPDANINNTDQHMQSVSQDIDFDICSRL